MLVGAAVFPAAPWLSPALGVPVPPGGAALPPAVRTAVDRLPPADVAILVATAPRGVYDRAVLDFAGIGRPDATEERPVHVTAVAEIARVLQLPRLRQAPLPLELAVLATHLDPGQAVAPVGVDPRATWDVLVATGTGLAQVVADDDLRAVAVVAGDGAASLGPKPPRPGVAGAAAWQRSFEEAVATDRLDDLRALGPEAALELASSGWAPLGVLHGAVQRAHLTLELLASAAPLGVGALVAVT